MEKDLDILRQIEKKLKIKFSRPISDSISENKNFDEKKDYPFLRGAVHASKVPIYVFDKDQNIIVLVINLTIKISNKMEELFKEIIKLRSLKLLFLEYNEITQFPIQIKSLPNLRRVSLIGNKIKLLTNEIITLPLDIFIDEDELFPGVFKKGINLAGNPIENPPIEIIKKGKNAVIDYFKSLEGEKEAINEVKVILVGDGGCGKTSLVKQVLAEKFDISEEQTHGINIRDWTANRNGNDIIVHFWDFGGQEIMHATHQFFLSKRSLYILVLDGRKDEKVEYWLKHIESFGGDSPILVVLNKIDQNPAFDVNRKFLKEKYKGIKNFFRVSCAKQFGINDFTINLIDELSKIEILETTWAKNWFNVKSKLEEMKKDFISYNEFKRLCKQEDIAEESSQDTLVGFLNDLGVIIHFKDIKLLDTHVLEPKWVTEAVYKIINSKVLAEDKGILKLDFLPKILRKRKKTDFHYPPDKYRFILDLMMKFELCYELDNQTILIPDLLEVQEPEFEFNYDSSLKFIVEYDFLPMSVMPRFMVRMHKDIKNGLSWRTGIVIEDKAYHSTALIKADERDKKIFIFVNGEQKRDYFSNIWKTIRDINNRFEKLQISELVPLPDDDKILIEYAELIGYELMGEKNYTVGKLRKVYSVSKLLNGFEKESDRKRKYWDKQDSKIINIHDSEVTIAEKEYKDMSKIITKIGDGATFHGDFMVGNKINDSFNKADSSDAPDELKELLKSLSTKVAKMAEQLPKDEAEQVADDLETFTKEAIKENPRRKWYELSAEGLKDAAKAVGDVGVSVLETLGKITPLLASIL